jgi:hypothetical protein
MTFPSLLRYATLCYEDIPHRESTAGSHGQFALEINAMNAMLNHRHRQKGAALAVGLILLVVATLVALATMRSSVTEERIAGNQREISEAFMAAEAGVAAAFQWFGEANNVQTHWGAANAHALITSAKSPGQSARVNWRILDPIVFLRDKDNQLLDTAIIESEGWVTTTGTSRIVRSTYKRPVNLGTSQAFLVGMLAENNIWVSGKSTFEGGIHANGRFDNGSGASTLRDDSYCCDAGGQPITVVGSITAKGAVNFTGNTSGATGPVQGNYGSIAVPSVSAYIEQNKGAAIERCDFSTLQPDLGGKVYFCNGSVILGNGNWTNGTIMATGSAEIKGRSTLGNAGEVNFAIFAVGDITNNGRDDSYGVYWTDGDFRQNGASLIAGSIVAGGGIRRNGAMTYQQRSNFNAGLPLPQDIDPPGDIELERDLVGRTRFREFGDSGFRKLWDTHLA